MARPRKKRRQSHGSAWHWQQTDCWYYTLAGTKKRVALFNESGGRIRGSGSKEQAELALAKIKLAEDQSSEGTLAHPDSWLVARVCSEYLQYCERGLAKGTISASHRASSVSFLNDFCKYCGALPVAKLRKGHVMTWIEGHASWKSPATHSGVIGIVLAAFGRAQEMFGVPNPIKGLKKPKSQPRLQSFTIEDEEAMLGATEICFRNFLFAALQTGLRPYCELARLTADDIEESDRGMMWRVYSTKTKKSRKIPVRTEVAELTRTLMKTAPQGSGIPLFRNTKGKPWKRMTGVVRFLMLKKKLGWNKDRIKSKYSSYTCRHTFVHRMLAGFWTNGVGCSIETVAELIGDTPKVAFEHYGKEWGQHFQDPLWAAIGTAQQASSESDRKASRAKRTAREPQSEPVSIAKPPKTAAVGEPSKHLRKSVHGAGGKR